jgi:hypothetical protein
MCVRICFGWAIAAVLDWRLARVGGGSSAGRFPAFLASRVGGHASRGLWTFNARAKDAGRNRQAWSQG